MSQGVKDYVTFGKLSLGKDAEALEDGQGGWIENSNNLPLAVFNTLYPAKFFAVLEFGENVQRGNHYHLEKEETIIVLSGELNYKLWLADSNEELSGVMKAGDYVRIKPNCAHSFVSKSGDALALEYGSVEYSTQDVIKL